MPLINQPILAKSQSKKTTTPTELTLVGHTGKVEVASDKIIASAGANIRRTFGFTQKRFDRFQEILRVVVILHDIGKANSGFEDKLLRGNKQPVRHEQVSYFLARDIIKGLNFTDKEQKMIFCAVIGHHRKFPDETNREGCGDSIDLFVSHPDFLLLLDKLSLGLRPCLPSTMNFLVTKGSDLDKIKAESKRINREIEKWTEEDKMTLAVLKACLICSDILGSAEGSSHKIFTWVDKAWSNVCDEPYCNKIAVRKLKGVPPRKFQKDMASSRTRVTLVKGGCGTGKTVGAYMWAAFHAIMRKLFFCYPTTNTGTEGFRDYLQDAEATLSHSRSFVDFQILGLKNDVDDTAHRLEASRSISEWGVKSICCTVDHVLGLLHNCRTGVFAFPSIVTGAFVFDEVHCYDQQLWQSLLLFIETFKVPILLMTASLSQERQDELHTLMNRMGEKMNVIGGPKEIEEMPRYQHSHADADDMVRKAYDRGEKVLIVRNKVKLCIGDYKRYKKLFPNAKILAYHSRFRYGDRVQRHSEIIDAFNTVGPVIAVCTQVAEMSLDISADLLVTDLAPIPSLIQRFGRLARFKNAQGFFTVRPFIILPMNLADEHSYVPYHKDDVLSAKGWLRCLGDGRLSQIDLINAWTTPLVKMITEFDNGWINGGMISRPGTARVCENTISVILRRDEPLVQNNLEKLPIYIIPMRFDIDPILLSGFNTVGYAYIVEDANINYDPLIGAEWVK